MNHVGRTCWCVSVFFLAGPAWGQLGGTVPSSQFELADTVQLDQVDNAVLAQWERVKALLADRQWDEAVEILRQLAESSEGKLLGVTNRRYVSLPRVVPIAVGRLAARGPETLSRPRVDPVAQKWYEQGIAERNRRLLENVVEQAFASNYGDEALMALGEMALESGDYRRGAMGLGADRAGSEKNDPLGRGSRHRRSPAIPGPAIPIPSSTWRPCVPGWCWSSILEGASDRAKAGTGRVHPSAPRRARSVGRPGRAVRRSVETTVAESLSWPAALARSELAHVCGQSAAEQDRAATGRRRRRGVAHAAASSDCPVQPRDGTANHRRRPARAAELLSGCWSATWCWSTMSQRILAVRLDTGKPAWGQAAIYQSQLAGVVTPSLPSDLFGLPRFTMTVFENRLLARMGSPVTGQPQGATAALRPGYLVCLDLAAEGRLLWKAEPEEGWAIRRLAAGRRSRRLRGHAPPGHSAAGVRGLFRPRHGPAAMAAVHLRRRNARPRRLLRKLAQPADARRRHALLQHESRRRGGHWHGRRPAAVGQSVPARTAGQPGKTRPALAARSEPVYSGSWHAAGRPGR